MKFSVFSLGCRVNTYEGQSMIGRLVENGFEATDELVYADCYILNTCSVTSEADKKSRQAVSRVKKLNPEAKIFVCGCSSQNDAKPFEEKDGVIFIGGVGSKMQFLDKVMEIVQSGKVEEASDISQLPRVYEDDLTPQLTTSRAYVKVQDGCNNFCSYCIIPYLRGRSRSRSLESIRQEAISLVGKTQEIVITGINVSAYGRDIGSSLKDLFFTLIFLLLRKRFGSLECTVIDEELLTLMKDCGFCSSFHLSMQSGCDKTLKSMNRKYTSEQFLEIVRLIRHHFPDAGITTDVITGFPTETEEDFCETMKTCEKAEFLFMHIFPYSERKGTAAAKMEQVDKGVRTSRAARLNELNKILRRKFLLSQEGKEYEVFIEEQEGEYCVGYTDNFIKVYSIAPIGSCKKHIIKEPFMDGVKGEVL